MSGENTQLYLDQIEDCEKEEESLTNWERTFLDDIKNKILAGEILTENQAEKLNQIWEKATS